MHVAASRVRINWKYYLDLVQNGQQIDVIRHSVVIARIVGADVVKILPTTVKATLNLSDGRVVMYRQMGEYEDPEAVHALKPVEMEFAQDQPAAYFQNLLGEFWIGEIEGVIVAYGGYLCPLDGSCQLGEVILHQVYTHPDLVGLDVEDQLRTILTERAIRRGYKIDN